MMLRSTAAMAFGCGAGSASLPGVGREAVDLGEQDDDRRSRSTDGDDRAEDVGPLDRCGRRAQPVAEP